MQNDDKKREQEAEVCPSKGTLLPFAGTKRLEHLNSPPPAPDNKRIHRRRPLPPVPEAKPRAKESEEDKARVRNTDE